MEAGDWETVRDMVLEKRVRVGLDDYLDIVKGLGAPPTPPSDFPFILAAGERRGFTANTIIRDPTWRKKDQSGRLRINPSDALSLGVEDGGLLQLTTKRGSAKVVVEISESMRTGHISLPNGHGLEFDGEVHGVAPNELTAAEDRDPFAGTPWHKYVPARLELA